MKEEERLAGLGRSEFWHCSNCSKNNDSVVRSACRLQLDPSLDQPSLCSGLYSSNAYSATQSQIRRYLSLNPRPFNFSPHRVAYGFFPGASTSPIQITLILALPQKFRTHQLKMGRMKLDLCACPFYKDSYRRESISGHKCVYLLTARLTSESTNAISPWWFNISLTA